ncbi:3-phosphoshikimate 1-carboxyvinyltransferase [Pseudoblastomonas halimionae]|uniref:3-phosphoshikimate 1-carboxyvinyltransferase n=1 Tax=Alteriqipengyuania halimionae TaxID=1926630 RepID=A0A6I4U658_9SPHN|nr:3-phosphoshikimate 1-carboxyvinyltransferase [Alteriqipengyuania halimionae]MXP09757.1 3-phosphoshikimate 1-carboxyvinyltransferase [Alteriqipengyuania halimionae]
MSTDQTTFPPGGPLRGTITVPGDKSISHRALMLGASAIGETRISGLLEGEDVIATAAALSAMGANIARDGEDWIVHGLGTGGLMQPTAPLDMGNSGTSTRLFAGLLASQPISVTLTGDASLSRRPMGRVIAPLSQMGAAFKSRDGCLPMTITGAAQAIPITYRLPVASAQVKSAVLLAALNTAGTTTVIEPEATRDHSERMLRAFGARIDIGEEDGANVIRLNGEADLRAQPITVPGDPSSAAFFITAALLVEDSDLTIRNVGMNPTRAGLVDVLRDMGGAIESVDAREVGGEPVADLRVRHSDLTGVDVDPAIAASMIDEFPVLFVAASLAHGTTRTSGLAELRVKESDRLSAMATALTAIGARVEEREDGLTVHGSGGEPLNGGGPIATQLDHRIAMSMAVAGLASREGVTIDDASPIGTSFPAFIDTLERTRA